MELEKSFVVVDSYGGLQEQISRSVSNQDQVYERMTAQIIDTLRDFGRVFDDGAIALNRAAAKTQTWKSTMTSITDDVYHHVKMKTLEEEKRSLLIQNMELRDAIINLEKAHSDTTNVDTMKEELEKAQQNADTMKEELEKSQQVLIQSETRILQLQKILDELEHKHEEDRKATYLQIGQWLKEEKPETVHDDVQMCQWIKETLTRVVNESLQHKNALTVMEKAKNDLDKTLMQIQGSKHNEGQAMKGLLDEKDKSIADLNARLMKLTAQHESTKENYQHYREQCEEKERQLGDEHIKLNELQMKLTTLDEDYKKQVKRLETELNRSEQCKVMLQRRLKKAEIDRDEAITAKNRYLMELTELQQIKDHQDEILRNLQSQVEDLKRQLQVAVSSQGTRNDPRQPGGSKSTQPDSIIIEDIPGDLEEFLGPMRFEQERQPTDFTCPICNEKFSSYADTVTHIDTVHYVT